MAEQLTTALNLIKGDVMGAIGAAAPIALGIMGTFLAWKYGVKFFKGLAK